MKIIQSAFVLAASVLTLGAFMPTEADAQPRRFGAGNAGVARGAVAVGPRRGGVVVRGGRRGYVAGPVRRGGPVYYGRRGPGVGAAVGLGVLGLGLGAAAAAAAAEPVYDDCLRQQEVIDPYGNVVVRTVRVC